VILSIIILYQGNICITQKVKQKGYLRKNLRQKEKEMFKHLNNKKLVDMINYRYENDLNDDDYIAELVRRRKASGKQIAIVSGEQFIIIKKGEENEN